MPHVSLAEYQDGKFSGILEQGQVRAASI